METMEGKESNGQRIDAYADQSDQKAAEAILFGGALNTRQNSSVKKCRVKKVNGRADRKNI